MSHMLFLLQLQQNGFRNSPHSFSQYQKISFIWCMKFHRKLEPWRLCRVKGRRGLWNPDGVTWEPAQPAPVRAISCPRTPAWVVSPRHVTSSGTAWRSASPRDSRGHGAVPRGCCGAAHAPVRGAGAGRDRCHKHLCVRKHVSVGQSRVLVPTSELFWAGLHRIQ